MSYPFILQGDNITIVIDSKAHTINRTHVTYQKVLEAIKAQDWDTVKEVIEPKKVVLNYGKGNVSIQGDKLFWKGNELHTSLSVRMIQMLQEGFPIEPMVYFMENLYQNPSKRAVDELYGFLEKSNLPITPDGHFLAYKKVRDSYFDCHSNSVLNKPAYLLSVEEHASLPRVAGDVTVEVVDGVTVVSMPRNAVDDNKDRTCSEGLHFCSREYLNHFGGARTVILKINPKDVVSIPSDYNDSKGRACRYEVIGELNVDPDKAFNKPVQETAVGSEPIVATVVEEAPPVNAITQEYDAKGRPLSMTKDAIRKRRARAARKLARAKVTYPTNPSTYPTSWPYPKNGG